ncbi:MAG: transcriptional regulator GcvA [Alphaproteobacteria bacterium]
MPRPLPPMTALRAFEMTARHRSVQRAAEALNVTPSAVSHQLRSLESALGVTLLRHVNRRLVLTEAGQVLLPGLGDGFARIEAALTALDASNQTGVLTVSMLSTFAVRWFIPRLPRFQKAHPEIQVHVSTGMRTVDFVREGIDAGIRYGRGGWPGLRCDRLLGETIVPVCSPALSRGEPALRRPADLARHTLLISEARPDDWQLWLSGAGAADLQPAHTALFETTNFALAAAASGAGVAIVARELVEEELALGRLVAPFDRALPREDAYYLVSPEVRAGEPKIAAFRGWLLREVAPDAG